MAYKLLDRAQMSVTGTPGTGVVTLGTALNGYQSLNAAGLNDGDTFPYLLVDGVNWEYGVGTYSFSAGTVTRTTITKSSAGSATPINASSKTILSATLRAEDINNSGTTLSALTDVSVTEGAAIDGYTLNWSNTTGRWVAVAPVTGGTSGSSTLAGDTDVAISSPATNQALVYNGSHWANTTLAAVALSNNYSDLTGKPTIPSAYSLTVSNNGTTVDSAAIQLNFVNATSITTSGHDVTITLPTGGGGGSSTLAGDTDVAISSPSNNQVLTYNSSTSKWVNATPSGGGGSGPSAIPYFTPPVETSLTAYQNLSGSSYNQVTSGGVPALNTHSAAGASDGTLYTMMQAAPSGSFSVTCKCRSIVSPTDGGWKSCGIAVRNSSTGQSIAIARSAAPNLYIFEYNSSNSSGGPTQSNAIIDQEAFLHLDYDGTNIIASISGDGVNKIAVFTATATSVIGGAPTQAGVMWGGNYIVGQGPFYSFTHFYVGASGNGIGVY